MEKILKYLPKMAFISILLVSFSCSDPNAVKDAIDDQMTKNKLLKANFIDDVRDGKFSDNPSEDTDGDGIINAIDPDSNDDAILDSETPPVDGGDINNDLPISSNDTDGDGIINAIDPDSDDDAILDSETPPVDGVDINNDLPIPSNDTDGDGIINAIDPDSDDDAILDSETPPIDGGDINNDLPVSIGGEWVNNDLPVSGNGINNDLPISSNRINNDLPTSGDEVNNDLVDHLANLPIGYSTGDVGITFGDTSVNIDYTALGFSEELSPNVVVKTLFFQTQKDGKDALRYQDNRSHNSYDDSAYWSVQSWGLETAMISRFNIQNTFFKQNFPYALASSNQGEFTPKLPIDRIESEVTYTPNLDNTGDRVVYFFEGQNKGYGKLTIVGKVVYQNGSVILTEGDTSI